MVLKPHIVTNNMLYFLLACSTSKTPSMQEDTAMLDDTIQDTITDTSTMNDTAEGPIDTTTEIEVCYLGPDRDNSICFPTIEWSSSWGEEYTYPEPYQGSLQYSSPLRYLDLEQLSDEAQIAPNFLLGEVMQLYKGRYALFMPHVIEKLQSLRDSIGGPLFINSGYRNVTYNASVGGVAHSRHIYGDAVDIDSSAASLEELQQQCESLGASFTSLYESHVHCDWREDILEPAFYGSVSEQKNRFTELFESTIEFSNGCWTAPAQGFTEGEPLRVWRSYDNQGKLLNNFTGRCFQTDNRAARIEVDIGGVLVRTRQL